MNPRRRLWLLASLPTWGRSGVAPGMLGTGGLGTAVASQVVVTTGAGDQTRQGALLFPRDHGAHTDQRLEWWYATGWLTADDTSAAQGIRAVSPARLDVPQDLNRLWGFQVTFFRVATGLAAEGASRFTPRHLLLAHAALTRVSDGRHVHAQRWGRWDGQEDPTRADRASARDADLALGPWALKRSEATDGNQPQASTWWARVSAEDLSFDLRWMHAHGPWLQGDAGLSTKAPGHVSRYVSDTFGDCRGEIQLRSATGSTPSRPQRVRGRVWVDHEWSDAFLPSTAVGWDWIGMHLDDGRSLMAFQLRGADGRATSAGGGLRAADGRVLRVYRPSDLKFEPLESWVSPRTGARYPLRWRLHTPEGRWLIRALVNDQEMDSRASLGTVYWEGLSTLEDEATGIRQGLGYLEMTGYTGRLRV